MYMQHANVHGHNTSCMFAFCHLVIGCVSTRGERFVMYPRTEYIIVEMGG